MERVTPLLDSVVGLCKSISNYFFNIIGNHPFNSEDRYAYFLDNMDLKESYSLVELYSFVVILGLAVNYIFSMRIYSATYISYISLGFFLIAVFLLMIMVKGVAKMQRMKGSIFKEQSIEDRKFMRNFYFPLFLFLIIIYVTQTNNQLDSHTFDSEKSQLYNNSTFVGLSSQWKDIPMRNTLVILFLEFIIILPILNFKDKLNKIQVDTKKVSID